MVSQGRFRSDNKAHLSLFCYSLLFIMMTLLPVSSYAADLSVSGTTMTIDSVRSQVQNSHASGATTIDAANGSLFTPGSTVFIITMQGSNIGQYEFNTISSISSNTLTLQSPLTNSYDSNAQIIEITVYDNVVISNSGILTCSAWNGSTGGVLVIKAANLSVDSTSFIDTSATGFLSETGPGAGTSTTSSYGGGGGAYGGDGGDGYGSRAGGTGYGLMHKPICMGSGGGRNTTYNRYGGKGGGIVFIELTGTAVINGVVRSNGQNSPDNYTYNGGAGAGGSIYISASAIAGTNAVSYMEVNGGSNNNTSYYGGGGGGGRIALHCPAGTYSYSGYFKAFGGSGNAGYYGGAGTVYKRSGTDENVDIVNINYNCDVTKIAQDGSDISVNVMYVEWAKLNYINFEGCNILDVRNSDLTLNPSASAEFDSIVFSVDLSGARTLSLEQNVTVNTVTVSGLDASNHANISLPGGTNINTKINLNGYTTLTNSMNMTAPALIYMSNTDNDITNNSNSHLRFNALELEINSSCVNNGTIEVPGDTVNVKSGATLQGSGSFYDNDNILTVYSGGTYIPQKSGPEYFHTVEFKAGSTVYHPANTTTEAYRLYFVCSGNMVIEAGVTIDLSGRGYRYEAGPGAGELAGHGSAGYSNSGYYYYGGGGAAYGGNGSRGSDNVGATGGTHYGSISNPMNIGSGGGRGRRNYNTRNSYSYSTTYYDGGLGGGAFIADVAGSFVMNGIIKVNGTIGGSGYGGGGAGGTININAGTFESASPSALLEANGGYGSTSYGGGGAGGRIAIKSASAYSFSGTMSAYGDNGYTSKYGAPGTIYLKKGADEYLEIKGQAVTSREYTYIDEASILLSSALIDLESADVQVSEPFSANTVTVLDSQVNVNVASDITIGTLSIGTTTSRESYLNLSSVAGQASIGTANLTGYNTSYHSRLNLPATGSVADMYLNGYTTVNNYGSIASVVMINTDNDIYNYATATIGFPSLVISNGSIFLNAGIYSIGDSNLTIQNGGTFQSQTADPMSFANVLVETGGTITQQASSTSSEYKIHMVCSGDFTLQQGASINANAKGYPNGYGPGKGISTPTSSYGGTGGSYGGTGSDGYYTYVDCDGYGSITDPQDLGSGGGNNTYSSLSRGGYGGGAVILDVTGTAAINGTVSANGENAPNGGSTLNGGGGSGGSINIDATVLTLGSTSVLQAIGGSRVSTSYRGGGGSGGRIALKTSGTLTISGTIQYYGGDGYGQINNVYGGAGTLYTREGSIEKLYIAGTGKERAATRIDDSLEPLNLALLSLNTAEVEITALTGCTELQSVNTDLIMNPVSPLTIDTVSISLNASAQDHRRCSFGAEMNLGDVTLQGYSTARHAELELINGMNISSSLQTNGYSTLYNYTAINLPASYTMSGTDNDIYNYATGSIILPAFNVSSGSYVQDFGVISPVDTNLTVQSGGIYDIAFSTARTYTNIDIYGTLTHTQDAASGYKLDINCTNNFTVYNTGSVDVSGKGYASEQGPGAGASQTISNTSYAGSGGSYGGWGSNGFDNLDNTNAPYGSIKNPVDFGSGGGRNRSYAYYGGSGGGSIDLNVTGTLTVNGTIKSNGENGGLYAGGGTGGSIRVITDTLAGTGEIQANGGARYSASSSYRGGGGSGGRIAVYTTAGNSMSSSLLKAYGAEGYHMYGASGTVYINNNGTESLYIMNNSAVNREPTIIADDAETPSGLDIFRIMNANVQVNKLASCNTMDSFDSDVDLNLTAPCTIGAINFQALSNSFSKTLTVPASVEIATLTFQGYNTSNRAIVILEDGVEITSAITLNGYTTLHNYTTIALPDDFNMNNTDNIIHNYSAGYITFASICFDSTFVFNTGTLVSLDKTITINSGSTFYNDHQLPDPDYDLIINSGGTYFSKTATPIQFRNVTVNSGGTMTHEANANTKLYTLAVDCSGDFTLHSGAVIDVTGKGYTYDQGPGAGTRPTNSSYGGGGAAYGGDGSNAYNDGATAGQGGAAFGPFNNPTELGSGGGSTYNASYGYGSAGGGAVLLDVAGTLTLDGTIKADGADVTTASSSRCGGGGSGGSVNLHAATITGANTSAMIQSKGGNRLSTNYGGGGGGGRIALVCTNYSYAGQFNAAGGQGYYKHGGTGTVYIEDSASYHIKIIGSNPISSSIPEFEVTPVPNDDSVPSDVVSYEITSANAAISKLQTCQTMALTDADVTINTPSACTIDAVTHFVTNTTYKHRRLTCQPNTVIKDLRAQASGGSYHAEIELINGSVVRDHFETNGYTTLYNYTTINLPSSPSEFTRSGLDNDIFNYATGVINLPTLVITQNSYVQDFGTINPTDTDLSIDNGGVYDIAKNTVLNFTDVVVNGTLTHTQNTTAGNKIKLAVGGNLNIGATGVMDATGKGYAGEQGPGAGANQYSTSSSYAGGGGAYGGWGSKSYNNLSNTNPPYGSLTNPADYGSGGGRNTYFSIAIAGSGGGIIDLNISGTLTLDGTIRSNGDRALYYSGGGSGGSIKIVTSAFAGASSGLISSNGGDRDTNSTSYRGGAGSGGRIAVYCSSNTYAGQFQASGGTGYSQSNDYYGGAGTIYIDTNGVKTIQVKNINAHYRAQTIIDNDGYIPADVAEYIIENADLTIKKLASCTSMTINSSSVAFEGTQTATITNLAMQGTNTAYNKAIITIPETMSITSQLTMNGYSQVNNYGFISLLILNNNYNDIINYTTGTAATPTLDLHQYSSFSNYGTFTIQDNNLVIGNGSTYTVTDKIQLTFNNITIQTGGNLTHLPNTNQELYKINIHCTGNLDIQSGGKIDVTAKGYEASEGPGAGTDTTTSSYGGGGASYGGQGSQGYSNVPAGIPYGSIMNPADLGSGGGNNAYYNYRGGAGGGAVILDVDGTMTLNGYIYATGGNPAILTTYNGGGGSGGSVNITANTFAGSGYIYANGANNGNSGYYGGGGGGGRIALTCGVNNHLYPDRFTAYGDYGRSTGSYYRGGAGTVYIKAGSNETVRIVNNSNQYQAPTPVSETLDIDTLWLDKAIVALDTASMTFDTVSSLNSKLTIDTVGNTAINDLNVTQNTTLYDSYHTILGENVSVQNATVYGINTSYFAYLTLEPGARITDNLRMNGYSYVYNHGSIDGLTRKSGTNYNRLYNYDTSAITVANLNLNTYDYFRYDGTVIVEDTSMMDLQSYSTLEFGSTSQLMVDAVRVRGYALITHSANTDTLDSMVNIRCTGDFQIDGYGKIDVTGMGYAAGEGPGAGGDSDPAANNQYGGGGGGAYGGNGGNTYNFATYGGDRGIAYDAETVRNPMNLGSGGGIGYRYAVPYYGGAGGGLIKLNIGGALKLDRYAYILADGASATTGSSYACGGGGAGGGINITTGNLDFIGSTGQAYIEADGGNRYSNYYGGGGGGGRIHIGYQAFPAPANFSIHAAKGTGYYTDATNGAADGSVDITADPSGTIAITAAPSILHANSNEVSNITAGPVRDFVGQTVGDGTEVTIDATAGTILNAADTNPDEPGIQLQTVAGFVNFDIKATPGTEQGTITVSAASVVGSATGNKTISVIIGTPTGTITLTPNPAQITANGVDTVTITSSVITDAFGNIIPAGNYVTVTTNRGTITTPDATGSIAGKQVQIKADGTIEFILLSSSTAGNALVTADSHTGDAYGEVTVSMVPGILNKLVVLMPGESYSKVQPSGKTGSPTARTAGTSYLVTVIAVDSYNNIIPTCTDTIELVSVQEFSTVSPSQQEFDGSTGQMTFTVTHYVAETGLYLTVNDISDPAFSTTGSVYAVNNAAPTKLQVLMPGETSYPGSATGKSGILEHQRAGQPFNIYINMVDNYFNIAQGRYDTVTLTSSSPNAAIPSVTLVNGTDYVTVTENDLSSGLDRQLSVSVSDPSIASGQSELFGVFNTIPGIVSVTPSESRPGMSRILTISGTEFSDGATVEFIGGGIDVTDIAFQNNSELLVTIYVQTTAGVGTRDVKITNPDQAFDIGYALFEVRDDDAPVISNLIVPAGATVGETVSITFDVDELLAADPIVTIDGASAGSPVGISNGGLTYTYEYLVNGWENTGYVPVIVTAQDFVGNIGQNQANVLFDFNNPSIGNTVIDPAVISPDGDFLNDSAIISFTVSDESNSFDVVVTIQSGLTPVRELWNGELNGKYFTRTWDGKDDAGNSVSDGIYLVKARVTDPANNYVEQNIGSLTVDYSSDQQPYIVYTEEVQFATIGNGVFTLPISLTNNDDTNTHTLSILDVINTDSSVDVHFSTLPGDVTIAPSLSGDVSLYVDSSSPNYDRVDVQLRLMNELDTQVDYSNLRIYMNPVPKPDLVVTAQDITFNPVNPGAGSNTTIAVTVRNVGNETASNIAVNLSSFGTPIGSGTLTISSLAGGEKVTLNDTLNFATTGMKLITVAVDQQDTIDELDEYNNEVNKVLHVGTVPLVSGGIRVLADVPDQTEPGSVVRVTGRADYALLINGAPNYDYPVKGATIYLHVKNTDGDVLLTQTGWFTTRTGDFDLSFKLPADFVVGDYALIKITITDHTFAGTTQVATYIYEKGTVTADHIDSPDTDGDGILNMYDADIDGDGIPNDTDPDIDGDGIANEDDTATYGPITGDPDIDGDGIPNYYDNDIDGDGIANGSDSSPYGNGGFSGYGGGYNGGFGGGSGSGYGSGYGGGGYGGFSGFSGFSGGFGGGGAGISIPTGGKIFTGTGESSGGYSGDPVVVDPNLFDAYVHSRDIVFSNDNPQLGEEISIGAIIRADGFGYKEDIPVGFHEIYPTFSDTQIGYPHYIPQLYAGTTKYLSTSWTNFAEGVYIIEVRFDNTYTDANKTNNEASRAIIVGELNQLLDIIINLPVEGMTYHCIRDIITIKFEVWQGFTMLAPSDLETLVLKFSDSLSLVSDIVVVKNGELVNGSFDPSNYVYTVAIQAPVPSTAPSGELYPGIITAIAQRIENDSLLNGSDSVGINLTAGKAPPSSLDLFATSYAVQLTWPEETGVSTYNVYRDDAGIATVTDTQLQSIFTFIDYDVIMEQSYDFFCISVDSITGKEGIVSSPVINKTVPKRRRR
ncbi:MAG: CARDB domain-containing protein [Candidatus Auribacterota bacterium]